MHGLMLKLLVLRPLSKMTFTPVPDASLRHNTGDDAAVRVAVRARPLLEKEVLENCLDRVSYCSERREVILGKEKRFTFDHVFGPSAGQEEIYLKCVKPLVDSCIAGYNATVLAYGQTGSGKTHTMGSANSYPQPEHELGILPRVIRQLYKSIEEQNQAEFLVKCSFVEIYNEEIKDLLHPETASKSIFIREDANGDIILAGVREEVATSFEDMLKCLEIGSAFRTTGSTLMNQHSSRSHAIFTIIVQQRSITDCTTDIDVITAKFHLVDLAGSERAKRTGAVGVRFKESVTINSGLLALGNVISALGDERKRGQHVPYRQSKLTRILQDSLGGNSRTCMIACISIADINYEETLNTLKYANRARNIRNKPIINRDSRVLQLNQLRQEVKSLQEELLNMRLRNQNNELGENGTLSEESHWNTLRLRENLSVDELAKIQNMKRRSKDIQQECQRLNQDLQDSQETINKLKEDMIELQAEKNQYQYKLEEIMTEMNQLLQAIPSWENSKEISESPMLFLLEMAKRIMADDAGDPNSNLEQFFSQGYDKNDQNAWTSEVVPSVTSGEILKDAEQRFFSICSSISERRLKSIRNQDLLLPLSDQKNKENSFADTRHSCANTPAIIKQYLKTIQDLEMNLAKKDDELREKDEALMEVNNDLARDDKIFSEKMQEIRALRKLTRELSKEKQCLLQKAQMDATIISSLSHEALVKEDELARLRASLESKPQELSIVMTPDNVTFDQKGPLKKNSKLRPPMFNNDDSSHWEKVDPTECQEFKHEVWDTQKTYGTCEAYSFEVDSQDSQEANNQITSPLQICSKKSMLVKPESWELSVPGTHEVAQFNHNKSVEYIIQDNHSRDPKNMYLEKKLREIAMAWHAEKQAMEDMVQAERQAWEGRALSAIKKHEQLEKDHQALKEELENTKSLMQKAGLGIRLSAQNVRELSNGDVDLRTSITLKFKEEV